MNAMIEQAYDEDMEVHLPTFAAVVTTLMICWQLWS